MSIPALKNTVNLSQSGFDLTDDFIWFRWKIHPD